MLRPRQVTWARCCAKRWPLFEAAAAAQAGPDASTRAAFPPISRPAWTPTRSCRSWPTSWATPASTYRRPGRVRVWLDPHPAPRVGLARQLANCLPPALQPVHPGGRGQRAGHRPAGRRPCLRAVRTRCADERSAASAARGWACTSCGAWPRPRAARSAWRRPPAPAPRSGCGCRSIRRRPGLLQAAARLQAVSERGAVRCGRDGGASRPARRLLTCGPGAGPPALAAFLQAAQQQGRDGRPLRRCWGRAILACPRWRGLWADHWTALAGTGPRNWRLLPGEGPRPALVAVRTLNPGARMGQVAPGTGRSAIEHRWNPRTVSGQRKGRNMERDAESPRGGRRAGHPGDPRLQPGAARVRRGHRRRRPGGPGEGQAREARHSCCWT